MKLVLVASDGDRLNDTFPLQTLVQWALQKEQQHMVTKYKNNNKSPAQTSCLKRKHRKDTVLVSEFHELIKY